MDSMGLTEGATELDIVKRVSKLEQFQRNLPGKAECVVPKSLVGPNRSVSIMMDNFPILSSESITHSRVSVTSIDIIRLWIKNSLYPCTDDNCPSGQRWH